jgi:hypothetical protein
MAAIVQSLDERRALDWAIDYFRNHADELTIEASRRFWNGIPLTRLLAVDASDLTPEEKNKAYSIHVHYALAGLTRPIKAVCVLASMLIEQGDPLPESIRTFLVKFLRGEIKTQIKRGPKFWDRRLRDVHIVIAIEHIVEAWKFPPTRNEASRDDKRRPSAASIVREGLKIGGRLALGESAITTIWNRAVARSRTDRSAFGWHKELVRNNDPIIYTEYSKDGGELKYGVLHERTRLKTKE